MKKIFTLVAAMMMTFAANAQTQLNVFSDATTDVVEDVTDCSRIFIRSNGTLNIAKDVTVTFQPGSSIMFYMYAEGVLNLHGKLTGNVNYASFSDDAIINIYKSDGAEWDVTFDKPSSAPLYFNEITTGINEARVVAPVEKQGIFDAQGRAVAKPEKKGLYIMNGKKFMVL